MGSDRWQHRSVCLAFACLVLAFAPAPARAGVNVALTPATQTVTPGSDFDVFVDVTGTSSNFNGFDLVVSFDPAVLTLVPLVPTSAQQGCLMTGACSAACGNTFHLFSTAGDSAAINDVLLCGGIAVQGPGRIYQLRFHAANVTQITALTIRRAQFFDAGLFVPGVVKTGCQVGIGVAVGVGPGGDRTLGTVRVEPNPSHGVVSFVTSDAEGGVVEAEIVDLLGRVVRQLGPASLGPQARLAWDGLDERGIRVPAGLYLVRIARGGQLRTARVFLLQ